MTKTPLEKSDIEEWTPVSFESLPAPPVFLLRPWTVRDRHRYHDLLIEESLEYYTEQDIRAEILTGLEENWSKDDFDRHSARIQAFWESTDFALESTKDLPPEERGKKLEAMIDAEEVEQINELQSRLVRAHRRLAVMLAANRQYQREAPKVSLCMFLVGWRNLDLPFSKDGGRPSIETIDKLQIALGKVEKQGLKDRVEGIGIPGLAFNELLLKGVEHLTLSKGEAKNSESPPSSQQTPNGSPKDGPDKKATGGGSQAITASESPTKKTRPKK